VPLYDVHSHPISNIQHLVFPPVAVDELRKRMDLESRAEQTTEEEQSFVWEWCFDIITTTAERMFSLPRANGPQSNHRGPRAVSWQHFLGTD
jgi:hypothetical protein